MVTCINKGVMSCVFVKLEQVGHFVYYSVVAGHAKPFNMLVGACGQQVWPCIGRIGVSIFALFVCQIC